jgi:HK97 family phage prohead protease
MNQIERRAFPISELRAKGENALGIRGHAAVFNSLSEDLGGFKEMIRAGAFTESIKKDDIRSLWNHDPNFVLGRNMSGTLKLEEDGIGLRIENDFPDTSYARDLMAVINRGDVNQMSFGFYCLRDDVRFEGGLVVRELIEAQLFDVSPVTFPAYPQTDVAARSAQFAERIAEARKAHERVADPKFAQQIAMKIRRQRNEDYKWF